MRKPISLILVLTLAGCQLHRPGEISPLAASPGCTELEAMARATQVQDLSPEQLEQLSYCQTVAAAEAARATETHTDFMADLAYLGILVNVAVLVIAVIVEVADR